MNTLVKAAIPEIQSSDRRSPSIISSFSIQVLQAP